MHGLICRPKITVFFATIVINDLILIVAVLSVSLDLLAADIRQLAKGMKDATGELINNKENEALKQFCLEAEPKITKLQGDLETAKVHKIIHVHNYDCIYVRMYNT